MKILKFCLGVLLFAALVTVVQLSDSSLDTPTAKFQQMASVSLLPIGQAELAAGRSSTALLLFDYLIENNQPSKAQAVETRSKVFAQLASENTPVSRLKATGWAATLQGASSFENLAGTTVADAALYGEIAAMARQGALDAGQDGFVATLNGIRSMGEVFPPADGAITLAKAAHTASAINEKLAAQLQQMLDRMQTEPRSGAAVEKFRDNFMPLFELAKSCRTWGEFETILRQADSADQLKVLTKMATLTPAAAERLAQILALAGTEGRPTAAACVDFIMAQGPHGLDLLYGAIEKGTPGLRFVADHPEMTSQELASSMSAKPSYMNSLQVGYQALRYQYGSIVPLVKYAAITILCGLLILAFVPGRYLEKLIARPGSNIIVPTPGHFLVTALAVGLVLSVLIYLLSLAMRPVHPLSAALGAAAGDGSPTVMEGTDNAFLSGTVVLISLAVHAVVWFFVRGKIRQVEDDVSTPVDLQLRRIENLDVFLDLPLFTGLALTVIAFILITLNAGMSRHFAYTSTVVGILSAVSLRIRYVYPLKERLIQTK